MSIYKETKSDRLIKEKAVNFIGKSDYEYLYRVKSENKDYIVLENQKGFNCDCKYGSYWGECSHILAVKKAKEAKNGKEK